MAGPQQHQGQRRRAGTPQGIDPTPRAWPHQHQGQRRRAGTPQRIDPAPRAGPRGTNVSDAGLEHLKGLTQLQTLLLDNTKVSDAGVEKLRWALPKCQIEPQTMTGSPKPRWCRLTPARNTMAQPAPEAPNPRRRTRTREWVSFRSPGLKCSPASIPREGQPTGRFRAGPAGLISAGPRETLDARFRTWYIRGERQVFSPRLAKIVALAHP